VFSGKAELENSNAIPFIRYPYSHVLSTLFDESFGFLVPAGELSSSSATSACFSCVPVAALSTVFLLPSVTIRPVASDPGLLRRGSGHTVEMLYEPHMGEGALSVLTQVAGPYSLTTVL